MNGILVIINLCWFANALLMKDLSVRNKHLEAIKTQFSSTPYDITPERYRNYTSTKKPPCSIQDKLK